MELEFEWHEAKAEANWQNHGVSFEFTKNVFNDYEEERRIIIGMADGGILLTVAYTERSEYRIRLISARRATKHEQDEYFNQNA